MKDFVNKHRRGLICVAIPLAAVVLSLIFKMAQGEKLEEVLGGLIIGVICDIVYLIISAVVTR